MATITVNLSARLRWWVRPYIAVLTGLARFTGMEPDWERVNEVLRRGVVVKVGKAKTYGNGRQEGA
ncbi:hypothetical protein ACQKIE_09925 [Luteibacter sp. NPDC031894]|uniref:hypothetical protein n=1 Tax=Luteibacter sp. NPDC031894 TaxID=3390572 RepID=UPI003D0583F6